ncbi:hypothetical protein EJB05_27529, partial [Eragrostis curvula]
MDGLLHRFLTTAYVPTILQIAPPGIPLRHHRLGVEVASTTRSRQMRSFCEELSFINLINMFF